MTDEKKTDKKSSMGRLLLLALVIIAVVLGVRFAQNQDNKAAGSEAANTPGGSIEEQQAAALELIGTGDVDEDFSYAAGVLTGNQLIASLASAPEAPLFDIDAYTDAITAVLTGKNLRISAEDSQALLQERALEQQQILVAQAEENKIAGDAFVETYEAGEGVQATEGGTLYKVLTEGEGELVGDQFASVLYTGTLIDGTVFDSTENNGGQPALFSAENLIPGMAEALRLMSVGDKWEIVVPVEAGYGEQAPAVIGPNQVLIFELEVQALQELPPTPEDPSFDEAGQ